MSQLVLIQPFLFSGETHSVSGTSFSYTLAADVALLTRNIRIIGEEYPEMMKESFGARLLVGTYSSAGINYKGNYYSSNTHTHKKRAPINYFTVRRKEKLTVITTKTSLMLVFDATQQVTSENTGN